MTNTHQRQDSELMEAYGHKLGESLSKASPDDLFSPDYEYLDLTLNASMGYDQVAAIVGPERANELFDQVPEGR